LKLSTTQISPTRVFSFPISFLSSSDFFVVFEPDPDPCMLCTLEHPVAGDHRQTEGGLGGGGRRAYQGHRTPQHHVLRHEEGSGQILSLSILGVSVCLLEIKLLNLIDAVLSRWH
jgi:hypothetical protein